jgi:hypothetical protein
LEFKNLNELNKYLKREIENSLRQDVAPKVIEVGKEHVQSDVYDVYAPKEYERTGKLKESFKQKNIPNGVEIENKRKDKGRYIPEIIEEGHDNSTQGYEYAIHYPNGDNYIQARPFIKNTANDVENRNLHTDELKKSLQNKGIDVT